MNYGMDYFTAQDQKIKNLEDEKVWIIQLDNKIMEKLTVENTELKEALKVAKAIAESWRQTIAQFQKERDAAIKDLREYAPFSATCMKFERFRCGHQCQSPHCSGWQWRGTGGN
jgi:predicted RNase H-like nuclease (RuvC/YqgF family)